jgi:hypothetical protein
MDRWISTSATALNDSGSGNQHITGFDQVHLYAQYRWAEPVRDTLIDPLPLDVATNGSRNPGYLGIGSSSSIIERLYALGLIAGRTYSLFLGSGFDALAGDAVVNGSNVFGGYDRARFKAPVHSYDMTPHSADYLRVSVSDVIIDHTGEDHPAQSRLSVMADEPAFEAVLASDRYPMLLPARLTRKLMANLHASPANATSSSSAADDSLRFRTPYNGTITVVLSDGFAVTLPPSVLADARGASCFAAPAAADYAGPYYLSAAWLSQVYLMLDFEARRFHLAAAVEAPSHAMSTTWCPGTVPDPGMKDMPSEFAIKGLVGAILGAVFGGVAVASIGFFAFLHFRRKRRAAAAEREAAAAGRKYAAYGKRVETARGYSSGGTTNTDLEMRKMTPPTPALDLKEVRALRAVRSRRASLDHASPASDPERPVSPVSDIAVETSPPVTAVKGSAAKKKAVDATSG